MYMQSEFNKLKQVIATDLHNSIDKNLNVYLDKVTQNDTLLNDLKKILFKLPEYQNLIKENLDLKCQIKALENQLHESTTKNIKLNISEVESKETFNLDLTILKLNNLDNENQIEEEEEKDEDEHEDGDEVEEEEEEEEEDAMIPKNCKRTIN